MDTNLKVGFWRLRANPRVNGPAELSPPRRSLLARACGIGARVGDLGLRVRAEKPVTEEVHERRKAASDHEGDETGNQEVALVTVLGPAFLLHLVNSGVQFPHQLSKSGLRVFRALSLLSSKFDMGFVQHRERIGSQREEPEDVRHALQASDADQTGYQESYPPEKLESIAPCSSSETARLHREAKYRERKSDEIEVQSLLNAVSNLEVLLLFQRLKCICEARGGQDGSGRQAVSCLFPGAGSLGDRAGAMM